MNLSRRSFFFGASAAVIAAPMIARADLLMPIKPTLWTPPWLAGQMIFDGEQVIGVWNGKKIISNISAAGEIIETLTPIDRYADLPASWGINPHLADSQRAWAVRGFMDDAEKITITTAPKLASEKRQQEFLERYKHRQLATVADDDLDITFSPREMAELKRAHKNIRETPRYSGGPFGIEDVKKLWGHS